jgi:pimeloyl-ACP methyl ester carboxylesterase
MNTVSLTLNRSLIPLVVIVVLASLFLAACGGGDKYATEVPEGAQAGDLVIEPCTYEAGKVEYAADCGTLVVPENRENPNSRLIALPVVRIKATGSKPAEPIFQFRGGPGQSNMAISRVSWFIENHDIVMVGYRGMDGSVLLDCPEVVALIKGGGREDILSDTALDKSSAGFAQCAGRLQDEGVDIRGYTVTETIDDIENARESLGYEQINLLSGSYGTNVARIYAYMYPERIFRSIMIAVDTPGATIHDPQVVDELLEYYADLCAQDAECSARTDDLAETMRTVSHNMPKRWLFFPINAGLVKVATYNSLESTTEAAKTIDLWLAAAEGDPSGMAVSTFIGPLFSARSLIWGHNAALRASLGQYDPAWDYHAELNPPDSIMGSPASTLAYAEYSGWPASLIPEEYRQIQPSDVETLLVSGSIDFDTPMQFARDELLPSLRNGQHVIVSEYGHGEFLDLQPEASERLLTSFYDTGLADDSLFTFQPVNFQVGIGYPAMAKLGLAAIVLVLVIVVAVIWFILRRVRRNRSSVNPN